MKLVLSIFPGADLLGMAFEQEGYCVVRGPDPILGGDIRKFNVPRGYFHGVIGGPPCQYFSDANMTNISKHGNLIPEFERIVAQAEPDWWLMENVVGTPAPRLIGAKPYICNAHDYGAPQIRVRAFWTALELDILKYRLKYNDLPKNPLPTILATEHKYYNESNDKRRAGRALGRQLTLTEINIGMGLDPDFSTPALNKAAAYEVRGNGVPLQMGRALAKSIKEKYLRI